MSVVVLKKGNHFTAPMELEKAQKLMNEGGYTVYINKTGTKLYNETAVKKAVETKKKKKAKKK